MSHQGVLEQVRDILFQTLCVKRGQLITKALAWDRANNGVQAIQEFLCEPKAAPDPSPEMAAMERDANELLKRSDTP